MTIKTLVFSLPLLLISTQSLAGSTTNAIIGGGIGGGAGAAIGHELGGRDGAILGGALGGATGAAIAADRDKNDRNYRQSAPRYDSRVPAREQNNGSFCPPGQRKKGRC